MFRSLVLRTGAAAAVVSLMTFALPALAADITIRVQDGDTKSVMYLTSDKMAAVSSEGTMVFDANAESITFRTESGTQVMTKERLKQMSEMASKAAGGMDLSALRKQMAQAREMALEAIKKQDMSPEQEAYSIKMINKQFPQLPGEEAEEPTTYKKMGKSKTLGGFKTEGYWIMKGDAQAGEMWVTSLKELGLSKDDFQVLGKMVRFFEEIAEGNPFMNKEFEGFRMMDPGSKDFVGIPISKTDDDGEVMLVSSIEKGKVDPSVFHID